MTFSNFIQTSPYDYPLRKNDSFHQFKNSLELVTAFVAKSFKIRCIEGRTVGCTRLFT